MEKDAKAYICFRNGKKERLKAWQGLLVGLVVIAVAVLAGFISINSIKEYNEKNSYFIKTTGWVVDYVDRHGFSEDFDYYDGDEQVAIVVEYEVEGQIYKLISKNYSNNPRRIGSRVNVKYNPNDYSDAIFALDISSYVGLIILGIFALAGVAVLFISTKKMLKGEKYI